MGTHGPQRDCYVALLSNMSLIHYKKGVNPSTDTQSYAEVDGPDWSWDKETQEEGTKEI